MIIKPIKLHLIALFCLGLTGIKAQNVTDIDGNVYNTVTIGTQTWMAENLKTTKYNDSTTIPIVAGYNDWVSLATPAYCWYENDETKYKNVYGALYNWYTVNTGKLCPKGWHVPTDEEYGKLTSLVSRETRIDNLGYVNSQAGGDLKEIGTTNWKSPNPGATNKYGFNGRPGGMRSYIDGTFYDIGRDGYWWTSTRYGKDMAYVLNLNNQNIDASFLNSIYSTGMSVRCLKD
jgi:uncharacterized protein (TIGR02145 family)